MHNMVDSKGRIQKGEHLSQATEFKKGQHWRSKKPHWNKSVLEQDYVIEKMSASVIAEKYGVTEANILYFLRKHGIPRRTHREARMLNRVGMVGKDNPMFGKREHLSGRWKGGKSPDRQKWYGRVEWREVRRQVEERDKGVCQICGFGKKGKRSIFIHHILSWKDYPAFRFTLTNLVTVCRKCHTLSHAKHTGDE